MSTIFTDIIEGRIPCRKVWEDDEHLAFLDIRPVQPGHTLVIPKKETGYLFDMSADEQAALWAAVRAVEAKLKDKLGCERVVLIVIGWEVRHVHFHLIPTNTIQDVPMPPSAGVSPEELERVAEVLEP